MKWPIFMSLLLLILAGTLFLSAAPTWLICIVCVSGGWWLSSLLEVDKEPDVFSIADWSEEK